MKFFVASLFVVAFTATMTFGDPIPVDHASQQAGHALVGGHAGGQVAGQFAGQFAGHGALHGDHQSQGYGRAESSNTFSFGAPLAGHGGDDFGGQFAPQGGHVPVHNPAPSQGQAQAHQVYTN